MVWVNWWDNGELDKEPQMSKHGKEYNKFSVNSLTKYLFGNVPCFHWHTYAGHAASQCLLILYNGVY